uniref:Galectin domain-containing protein n=1 Tax=Globodera pallida TaxID=36090 RepID=A0A183CDN7_GLOPA
MIIPATTLFLLAAFCSCFHQSFSKKEILYLSDPAQNYFETKYNAMDQCFSKETRERIFSFALKFKLDGKCKKGMLICYPGALDINGTKFAYGMAPGVLFIVKNEPGNDVAIKCAEKQRFECTTGSKEERKKYCLSGSTWHGIRLSKPTDASDMFLLELSFTNKTLYLSDPAQNYFETKYNAMDQCFSKETREQIFSFALKFKLDGKCKKGMLICYPGALDINGTKFAYGMAPGVQFGVKNEPGNDVAIKCAEKQRFECTTGSKEERKKYCLSGSTWHGIRLSKPTDASDLFLLELSFTNKTYQFNPKNEFSIEFGDQDSLITVLKDRLGNRIAFSHDEDNAICKAYLTRTAEKGVHLSNYLGLWMLGLDFLPINFRETLQLHVYRDCGCELHASFLTPNDNPSEVTYGMAYIPHECRPLAEQFELALQTPISNNKRIRVMFRVNYNATDYVSIRLGNLKRDLVMLMKIRGDTIILGSNIERDTRISLKRAGRNSLLKRFDQKYLRIDFVVRAYFYETRINGIPLTRYFPWPHDWWLREGETVDVAYVELNGGLYPDSADTEILETRSLRDSSNESAHIDFGRPLCVGDSVIIRGQINKDADRLYISLLHNAFEADTHLGTALLEIQLNFTDGGQNYLASSYQQWSEEDGINKPWKFKEAEKKYLLQRGDAFQMRILLSSADKDDLNTHLMNGSTTLPHWAIQYIRIDGNLIGNETHVTVQSGSANVLYDQF